MPEGPPVAWCTNVHDAKDCADLQRAIEQVCEAVHKEAPDVRPRVGLWLPPEMADGRNVQALRQTLSARGLQCIGLNAFPAMQFHADVVKTAVYRPAWDDPRRLQYTRRCAKALTELLEPGDSAGLTTVPIGWPGHGVDVEAAVGQIRHMCDDLERVHQAIDIDLHLAIEPEPGCLLDTTESLARFVEQHQLHDLTASGRLRACLDVCHLAVMHESADDALDALARAHLAVGRVQVSSAVEADMTGSQATRDALADLDEPRWMHQTTCLSEAGREDWPDLPDALAKGSPGLWRTHLHVPVHLQSFGLLGTTQGAILDMLRALHARDLHPPLEVETYAWSVLPEAVRLPDLSSEIARELLWVRDCARAEGWT
ncbi:MAG: metabolite traffic protein EboE [Phycisphaerales bacterium]|nr:metabolite traffic protein EboE [Phycisphaerales bacterium]